MNRTAATAAPASRPIARLIAPKCSSGQPNRRAGADPVVGLSAIIFLSCRKYLCIRATGVETSPSNMTLIESTRITSVAAGAPIALANAGAPKKQPA